MIRPPEPRRGQIWWADLPEDTVAGRPGPAPSIKVRPVLVMTRDPMGRHLSAVVAAPVTSTVRNVPSEVVLGPEDGLPRRCAANLDGVATVRRIWLRRLITTVSAGRMDEACAALAFALDCRRF